MDIKVYGRKDCGYCVKALQLLQSTGTPYNYFDVDSIEEGQVETLKEQLVSEGRPTTLPVIYVNGSIIGGFLELEEMFDDSTSNTFGNNGSQYLAG